MARWSLWHTMDCSCLWDVGAKPCDPDGARNSGPILLKHKSVQTLKQQGLSVSLNSLHRHVSKVIMPNVFGYITIWFDKGWSPTSG